jgi:hypothetical protein
MDRNAVDRGKHVNVNRFQYLTWTEPVISDSEHPECSWDSDISTTGRGTSSVGQPGGRLGRIDPPPRQQYFRLRPLIHHNADEENECVLRGEESFDCFVATSRA